MSCDRTLYCQCFAFLCRLGCLLGLFWACVGVFVCVCMYVNVCARETKCVRVWCNCVFVAVVHRGSFSGAGQSGGDPRADRLQREGHGLPPQRLPGPTPSHPTRCESTALRTLTWWRDWWKPSRLPCTAQGRDFLLRIRSLSLQLYDKINSRSTPQIRNPPSDGVQRAKEVRMWNLMSPLPCLSPFDYLKYKNDGRHCFVMSAVSLKTKITKNKFVHLLCLQ